MAGSAAGAGAALVIALAAGWGQLVPPGWVLVVAGAGSLAALLEGLLSPLEARGALDNDGVNAVSVLAGGALAFGWGLFAGSGLGWVGAP